MSSFTAAVLGGAILAVAIMLGTIVNRLVPAGAVRRACEEIAMLLGCAAPASRWRCRYGPNTTTGRVVLAIAAAAVVIAGFVLDRFDTALIGLALGAAEASIRPAFHRNLARKARDIGH